MDIVPGTRPGRCEGVDDIDSDPLGLDPIVLHLVGMLEKTIEAVAVRSKPVGPYLFGILFSQRGGTVPYLRLYWTRLD